MKILISNAHQKFRYRLRDGGEAIILAGVRQAFDDSEYFIIDRPLFGAVIDSKGAFVEHATWAGDGRYSSDKSPDGSDIVSLIPTTADVAALKAFRDETEALKERVATYEKRLERVLSEHEADD